jgi:hypothetical protein
VPASHRGGSGSIQVILCGDTYLDKVALEEIFLQVLRFSPVCVIPPMLHTYAHLHLATTTSTNRRSVGTFRKSGSLGYKSTITFSADNEYNAV